MEKIDIDDIIVGKPIGYGSFSFVYEALCGADMYAFKRFNDEMDFLGSDIVFKMDELLKLNLQYSLIPRLEIVKDSNPIGFLVPLASPHDLGFADNFCLERKLQVLKKLRRSIEELHYNGVVHGDIHTGNFLLRDEYLIDFDNCCYKDFPWRYDYMSEEAQNYLNVFGMNKELDVYLFNRTCYALINQKSRDVMDKYLGNKFYGYFNTPEAIRICDSLLPENNIFNGDYLIDTIDETMIRERSQ